MQSSKVSNLPSLTGIRSFAAVWVLLYHYTTVGFMHPSASLFLPLIMHGHFAVDLFFILSGFILSYNYYERFQKLNLSQTIDFLFKRLARLYPVHIFCFMVSLAMFGFLLLLGHQPEDSSPYTFPLAILNVFMLHAWWPGLPLSWNFVSWSISAEWFAYSVVFLYFVRYWRRWSMYGRLLLLAVLATLYHMGLPEQWVPLHLLRISYGFLLGVLTYNVRGSLQKWAGENWRIDLILTFSFAFIILVVSLPSLSDLKILLLPVFAVVIGLLSLDRGAWAGFTGLRLMVYLGEISYSLYMVHGLIYKVALQLGKQNLGFEFLSPWINMLLWTLLSIAIADRLYHWLEIPGRNFILDQYARFSRGQKDR